MPQDMSSYRSLFISEMRTNMEDLEDFLSILKKNPSDIEVINEVFRITHTIKGMAATMGYNITSDLGHRMEDMMSRIRSGKVKYGDIELLVESSDMLNELLEGIISNGNDNSIDISHVINKYEKQFVREIPPSARHTSGDMTAKELIGGEVSGSVDDVSPVEAKPAGDPKSADTYDIQIAISESSLLKDARTTIIIKELKKKGVMKGLEPSAGRIESGDFDGKMKVILETDYAPSLLKRELLSIREVTEVSIRKHLHSPHSNRRAGC